MAGLVPGSSGIGIDCSTNYATTTALHDGNFYKIHRRNLDDEHDIDYKYDLDNIGVV